MATSARLDELKKKFDENPRRYFAPLANEYRKLGDLTQAIALCRAHLPNQPGHISGHIVLAQALYEARELGESRQIFEASLDLDPENLIALRYLGDIAREQGEPLQARGWYERVLDADPRNEDIAQLLRELDGTAVASPDEDESRVPALEDLPQPPLTGFEPRAFSTNATFGSTASGAHPIDPLVADAGSETPPWGSAAAAPSAEEFAEQGDALHDLPADGAPLAFFEETTAEDVFAATTESSDDSDPFFGAAAGDEARSFEANDLPERDSAPDEDWFAAASASPEHEGIEGLPMSESSPFEDSFLPDLSEVTPIDSRIVSEVSDPEAAPTFVDEQADDYAVNASLSLPDETPVQQSAPSPSSIPTPPFLSALDDEVPAERSSLAADLDAASAEAIVAAAPTPVPFAVPFDAYSSDDAAPELDHFDDEPTIGSISLGEPEPEATASAANERDEPTLEVEATSPFAVEPDVASEDLSVDFEVADDFATAASASESPAANFDDLERDELTAEPSAVEGASLADPDFVLEYGEFVAPEGDETPFIASTVSVPLANDESSYDAPALVSTKGDHAERDADEIAPVEGLISREVDAVRDEAFDVPSDDEVESPDAAPFVTETMAELYLQQGFSDEALAIYRQLLAQQPGDASLQDRIAAIERGASSTVVVGVAPRDTIDRAGQSVRHFFSHFARRAPRSRSVQADDVEGDTPSVGDQPVGEPEGRTAGAANRDEALTVPDEGAPPATLSQLFASGVVSGADEDAASNLSSAYSADESAPATRIAERELSLEHLFRDVPARSSGAVTLDEFYEGSSSGGSAPATRDAADGEERGADIEQFTAWLEGLKKK